MFIVLPEGERLTIKTKYIDPISSNVISDVMEVMGIGGSNDVEKSAVVVVSP